MNIRDKFFSKNFWKKQNFFKELNLAEHLVVWISVAWTTALFIYSAIYNYAEITPYLTLAASLANICSVGAMIKKKPLFAPLGILASLILIPVCWYQHTYAMMFMYAANVVTLAVSFITWIKNTDKTASITPRSAKWWQILIYCVILLGLIALYTWVESLQSYQDFISGKHIDPIPPLYLLFFDSASLMISISIIVPMSLRLKNLFPLYICGNAVQMCTWISKLVLDFNNFNVWMNDWMMLINVFMFLAMNILGIINWNKSSNKK